MELVSNTFDNSSLIIFNLSTDKDNVALSFACDWIEEFAKRYAVVRVWSVHVGFYDLPANVRVTELGGGSLTKRFLIILRIFPILFYLIKKPNSHVFYHMNAPIAALLGTLFKIFKIPQILWYSHAHASAALRIAVYLVNKVVSTSSESFPLFTKKLIPTGHGVRDQNTVRPPQINPTYSISFLGRVSRVKRLEILLNEVSMFQKVHDQQFKIFVIGPCEGARDQKYKSELTDLAKKGDVELIFIGSIPHKNVQFELSKCDLAFNGTLKSLDKGAIESVFAKCILISDQSNTLIECGYSDFSLDASGEALTISEQLSLIVSLSESQKTALTEKAKIETFFRHSLSSTIDKICMGFSNIKSSNEK